MRRSPRGDGSIRSGDSYCERCAAFAERKATMDGALASLQEPSAGEYRRQRLFDSRRPRRRLLGRGKVVEVTPLPPRRQRVEGPLETWVLSEPLRQLLGDRKI